MALGYHTAIEAALAKSIRTYNAALGEVDEPDDAPTDSEADPHADCGAGTCSCTCRPLPKKLVESQVLVRAAGQAATALLLGLQVDGLALRDGEAHAAWSWQRGQHDTQAAMTHLAPDVAEALFLKRPPTYSLAPNSPHLKAMRIIMSKGLQPRFAVDALRPKVQKLLAERTTWGAVICLAGELAHRGRMTGQQVKDYIACVQRGPLARHW